MLDRLAPDAFLQAWGLPDHSEQELLRAHGYRLRGGFWVRLGSPRIHWAPRKADSAPP